MKWFLMWELLRVECFFRYHNYFDFWTNIQVLFYSLLKLRSVETEYIRNVFLDWKKKNVYRQRFQLWVSWEKGLFTLWSVLLLANEGLKMAVLSHSTFSIKRGNCKIEYRVNHRWEMISDERRCWAFLILENEFS